MLIAKRSRKWGYWCGLLVANTCLAQHSPHVLPTLSVYGTSVDKYTVGAKIMSVDSATLRQYGWATMGELLSQALPIATKIYGDGRLTSVSFRGTAASHTALLWNGININQPTLGQSDFSTIPIVSFDQLQVHFGGASSNYGSDAVGGGILLRNVPTWSLTPSTQITFGLGSFSRRNLTFTHRWGGKNRVGQWESKTTCYGHLWPNKYPYDSLAGYVVGRSTVRRAGFTQDFYQQDTKGRTWALHAWGHLNHLNIEPLTENTNQHDAALRLLASLQGTGPSYKFGLFKDYLRFQASHSNTLRWLGRTEHEWRLNVQKAAVASVRVGAELNYYLADVDGYMGKKIREWRTDFFVLSRLQASPRVRVSVNVRQGLFQWKALPLTPTVGIDWVCMRLKASQLNWRATLARSYHVPTLNERFWIPQGNPNIRPEKGWVTESSLAWEPTLNTSVQYQIQLTAYHKKISDWIIWNPERNYRAENLQEAIATGIEAVAKVSINKNEHSFNLSGYYSLTRSTYQRLNSAFDQAIIGKQLIYVPIHTAGGQVSYIRKQYQLTMLVRYNGWVYTTSDNTKFLPGSCVLNGQLSRKFRLNQHSLHLSIQIQNLLNSLVLSVENKALPGRSFLMSSMFHF
jgi:vitamin B12 transporter